MSDTRIVIGLIVGLPALLFAYCLFGMTKDKYEYALKGWFFAPARWFRQFLCGMFPGHNYVNNKCSNCLKKKRRRLSDD